MVNNLVLLWIVEELKRRYTKLRSGRYYQVESRYDAINDKFGFTIIKYNRVRKVTEAVDVDIPIEYYKNPRSVVEAYNNKIIEEYGK